MAKVKLAVVVCVVLFAVGCFAQTCSLQDNTDFDNGYLTMLYNVASAQACCDACNGFEDCAAFSWIKNPDTQSWYKRCFIKDSATGKKTDTGLTAGTNGRNFANNCSTGANIEDNVDYDNGWLSLVQKVPTSEACCKLCGSYPGCNYWTWSKDPAAGDWYHRCYLKASNNGKKTNTGTTSGKGVPTPSVTPRKGKRGLAWFNSLSCSDLKLMKGVSWIYNWGTGPDYNYVPCMHELGIEFLPMQWGGGGLDQLNFTIWGAGSALLGFNEPNFHSQSNVSPTDAAKQWPMIEAIAKARNMRVGSPAAAACGPDPAKECYAGSWSPVPWFDDFFKACANCKVDFLTTHIYSCNMTEIKGFIDSLRKYNKPIWLTEFACPAAGQPDSFEYNFMKDILAYLDGESVIERYAWFGTRIDPTDGWLGPQVDLLDNSKCALTNLGKLYTGQA